MSLFGFQITWIEFFGVIFNLLGVWLTIRKNKWCFPVGIIGVMLYVLFYFQARLYADTLLQVFYIGLLAYGWAQWGKANDAKDFVVTRVTPVQWLFLSLICIGSTLLIGTIFHVFTDATLPYLDALLTSMSLVAQWLVARKKLENWIVWIVADILYVGLFLFKEAYPTAILYFIFILLAVAGFLSWKKKLRTDAIPNGQR
jgi:nicotinamide mononucleotide transporter